MEPQTREIPAQPQRWGCRVVENPNVPHGCMVVLVEPGSGLQPSDAATVIDALTGRIPTWAVASIAARRRKREIRAEMAERRMYGLKARHAQRESTTMEETDHA